MFAFIKSLFQPKTPNAALAWQRAGNEVGNSFWLYAVPVHLVLQRDSFSLAEPVPLPLESDEIDALTTALNKHFEADDLKFFWHGKLWILRLAQNPYLHTNAPEAAINKDISAYLPKGEGAIKWAAFTNEIQMLLFEHPVNLAREAKRMPAINSIWCHGLGQINHAN
jgi:hypothetical protein